jgi:hypothetical protein
MKSLVMRAGRLIKPIKGYLRHLGDIMGANHAVDYMDGQLIDYRFAKRFGVA